MKKILLASAILSMVASSTLAYADDIEHVICEEGGPSTSRLGLSVAISVTTNGKTELVELISKDDEGKDMTRWSTTSHLGDWAKQIKTGRFIFILRSDRIPDGHGGYLYEDGLLTLDLLSPRPGVKFDANFAVEGNVHSLECK